MSDRPWWEIRAGAGSLLDRVRQACETVAASAHFVRIDDDRIAPFVAALRTHDLPEPTWDRDRHFLGSASDTASFVLALDSVNFGSGWWPVLRKRPGHSGYLTIAASLTDRFRERGPWSANDLVRLTPADCAEVFGQDPVGATADLMAHYARSLNDLGSFLLQGWDGDPLGPFAEANGSAERLIELLVRMPLFRDAGTFAGRPVPILKRAQLLAADATLAFAAMDGGAPPVAFADLDRLTIFADNLVPHVLRREGVLRYDDGLLDRIVREERIPAGSPEEIEIRAVALHAAELIVGELRRRGIPTNAARLDFLLWHRGRDPVTKAHRRHRTRTTAY